MSGRHKPSKARIQMAKPDLPPFLQKMKEQIVANEDADRRERSEKRRKERGDVRRGDADNNSDEDGPTIVKVNDDDLTEEQYKRMKLDLETQYKLIGSSEGANETPRHQELNVDELISVRKEVASNTKTDGNQKAASSSSSNRSQKGATSSSSSSKPATSQSKARTTNQRQLSYGTSSEDEDEDGD